MNVEAVMVTNKLPGMTGRLAVVAALCLITTRAGATLITEWLGESPRPADWAVITDATYDADGSGNSIQSGAGSDAKSADGSGMALVGGGWYHTSADGNATPNGFMVGWNATNTGSTETGAGNNNGYVEYTFDKAYTIKGLMMWGVSGSSYYRSTQIAQFFTTTDGVNWDAQDWTDGQNDYNGARTTGGVAETGTLTPTNTDIWQFTETPSANQNGDNPATDVYSGLNWENVTAVRFAPRASYASSAIGVGEIQFVAIPEPGTMGLIGVQSRSSGRDRTLFFSSPSAPCFAVVRAKQGAFLFLCLHNSLPARARHTEM